MSSFSPKSEAPIPNCDYRLQVNGNKIIFIWKNGKEVLEERVSIIVSVQTTKSSIAVIIFSIVLEMD